MNIRDQWDGAAGWYDKNMGEAGDTIREIIHPTLFKLLGNLDGKTVLDSGCGNGYLTRMLAKTAKRVIGIDFSKNFVEICRKKYRNVSTMEFQVGDVSKTLPFPDQSFDVIISQMVLQYVPDITIFAKESFRMAKKNGKLIIIVDHPFNTQFHYAQKLAGVVNPKYPELNDYFSTKPCRKLSLWGKVTLTWYPRTIGSYINACTEAGFSINRMEEIPEITKDTVIPRILILECSKK